MSKFAAGCSRRRNVAIAATIVGFAVPIGTATANATEEDEEFLADLSHAKATCVGDGCADRLLFETPAQAIQLGKGVCWTIDSGLAEGVSDDEVRGRAYGGLQNTGLSGMDAHTLLGIAVDNYCPQYLYLFGSHS